MAGVIINLSVDSHKFSHLHIRAHSEFSLSLCRWWQPLLSKTVNNCRRWVRWGTERCWLTFLYVRSHLQSICHQTWDQMWSASNCHEQVAIPLPDRVSLIMQWSILLHSVSWSKKMSLTVGRILPNSTTLLSREIKKGQLPFIRNWMINCASLSTHLKAAARAAVLEPTCDGSELLNFPINHLEKLDHK